MVVVEGVEVIEAVREDVAVREAVCEGVPEPVKVPVLEREEEGV